MGSTPLNSLSLGMYNIKSGPMTFTDPRPFGNSDLISLNIRDEASASSGSSVQSMTLGEKADLLQWSVRGTPGLAD